MKRYYSAKEAARALGISCASLYNGIADGRLPPSVCGSFKVVYDQAALDEARRRATVSSECLTLDMVARAIGKSPRTVQKHVQRGWLNKPDRRFGRAVWQQSDITLWKMKNAARQ